MPLSSRDFQRAARQRYTTAEFLLRNRYNLDAMYLAGYVVECSLKALILELTPIATRAAMLTKISSGKHMHEAEILGGILKDLQRPIPLGLVKRLRRSGWSTALRYEAGRWDTGESRAFLKTADEVYNNWVGGQLPMSQTTQPRWESMKTDESRLVEQRLKQEFPQTDAYRYNSASIRVRVVDPRFEGHSIEKRDAMVEPFLAQLPEEIQADIMNLLTLAPSELEESSRKSLLNEEFEDPSPSSL